MEHEFSSDPDCLAFLFLFHVSLQGLAEALGDAPQDRLANTWIGVKGSADGTGQHLGDRGADPYMRKSGSSSRSH
jgi:hypothetical protein